MSLLILKNYLQLFANELKLPLTYSRPFPVCCAIFYILGVFIMIVNNLLLFHEKKKIERKGEWHCSRA
jgi:hypothetical protein